MCHIIWSPQGDVVRERRKLAHTTDCRNLKLQPSKCQSARANCHANKSKSYPEANNQAHHTPTTYNITIFAVYTPKVQMHSKSADALSAGTLPHAPAVQLFSNGKREVSPPGGRQDTNLREASGVYGRHHTVQDYSINKRPRTRHTPHPQTKNSQIAADDI